MTKSPVLLQLIVLAPIAACLIRLFGAEKLEAVFPYVKIVTQFRPLELPLVVQVILSCVYLVCLLVVLQTCLSPKE